MSKRPVSFPVLVLRRVGVTTFLAGSNEPKRARLLGDQMAALQRLFGLQQDFLDETDRYRFEVRTHFVRIRFSNGVNVARMSVWRNEDDEPVTVVFVDRPSYKVRFLQLGAEEIPPDEWPHEWVLAAMRLEEESEFEEE